MERYSNMKIKDLVLKYADEELLVKIFDADEKQIAYFWKTDLVEGYKGAKALGELEFFNWEFEFFGNNETALIINLDE